VLTPDADGWLRSERALPTAFMAPRLQGEHHPDGRLELSLWGAGRLGRLRTTHIAGPFRYGPNAVVGARASLHVARSAPALVMRGTRLLRVTPARRSATWADAGPPAAVRRDGALWRVDLGWGCLRVEQRGADLVVAAGADGAEAERGLALSVEAIVAEGEAYAAGCDRLSEADPLLRSLVLQGAHAAWASVRRDAAGGFAGLSAGMAYSAPARTYYRDGYWTLPMLLQLEPEAARAAVLTLAEGVQSDGEAPSAVVLRGQAAWETSRAAEHARSGEWWSDHFDSPLFFVLAVDLVAGATGDEGLVEACRPQMRAVFERYMRLGEAGEGLPLKPRHDRDWADNVFRSGAVAYDLGSGRGCSR
jgi:hypothetical protein